MRKSSPFVSIPTVPRTLSGQWLTFSHMANHYRKILNVKPRVDTAAPKFSYMENAPKPSPKLKKAPRKQFSAPLERDVPKVKKKNVGPTNQSQMKLQRPKKASDMIDFEFQTLRKAFDNSSKIVKPAPKSSAYQVVFGPSKLKQSREDLSRESLIDERIGEVGTMGIAEKIKLFLDHIHDYDMNNNRTPRGQSLTGPGRKERIRSREELNESYLARHSKCFIPAFEFDKKPRNPQQNNSYGNMSSLTSTPTKQQKLKPKIKHVYNSDHSFLTNKQNLKNLNGPTTIQKNSGNVRSVDNNMKKRKVVQIQRSRSQSPGSISAGTIHGSDELTEARLLPLSSKGKTSESAHRSRNPTTNRVQENNSVRIIDDHDMSSTWLKEKVDKGLIRINNAYFQLGNGTSSTMSASAPAFGILNNKDSSRDSAYGFSSGESRITTTRESTPEKIANSSKSKHKKHSPDMGKYKSSLSTVASSNQDSPARSVINKYQSRLGEHREFQSTTKPTSASGSNWMSDNRYLDFLTAVTDDVVSRGIYTNKGLKTLFQSHVDKNPDLDTEKMMHMLNRLRMDVGVPMDDALNQLEFGYGSVKYSTPLFFSRNSGQSQKPAFSATTSSRTCNKESEFSVHELHHRQSPPEDYHSSDEGNNSKASSCNTSASVIDGGDLNFPANNSVSRVSSQTSQDSVLSLTESEIANALKQVGFDSESTMDIVNIIGHQNKSKSKQKSSRGLPQHHHQPSTYNMTSKSKSLNSGRSNSRGSAGSC